MILTVGLALTSPNITIDYHASPSLSFAATSSSTEASFQAAGVPGVTDNNDDRGDATPVPTITQSDAELQQQHARQLALSRQKPFSAAKESTQMLVVSRLFAPVVEFVETKLQEMGRVVDGPVDIGHVLQHSGARQLNQATRQRGYMQALGVSQTLMGLPSSVRVSSADAQTDSALSRSFTNPPTLSFKMQLSQSPLVRDLVTSYRRAVASNDKLTGARILSTLAESFTRQQLKEWVFCANDNYTEALTVSRHSFKNARSNARGFGAGNVAPNVKSIRRRIKDDSFGGTDTQSYQHCVNFLFVVFVKGRGEAEVDGGNKSLPSECVRAMFLLGTEEGATIFCETATDRAFMIPSNPPSRTFKLNQLLSEDQLKAELRKPFSALQKSAQTVAAREAEHQAQAADPLRRAIFRSQTVTLKRKWSILVHRYSTRHNVDEEVAAMVLSDTDNLQLSDRRHLVLDFLDATGRSPEDVQLFI